MAGWYGGLPGGRIAAARNGSVPNRHGDYHRAMRTPPPASRTVALRLVMDDAPEAMADVGTRVAAAGGTLRNLATVRRPDDGAVELEVEIEGAAEADLVAALEAAPGVRSTNPTRELGRVFGKRIIVVGGGAQVAQVALGAVSEADRHNLRGERISVDTIPLVGEAEIAAAVRAVADLPRAHLLVLAGSIMGGDITTAALELRERGIPIIALNMVGSIGEAVDLVVSDPVQAGTMAVMAIADTAAFVLSRQRGRRY
jgi:energy-converting hydrogenase B subunit Q